MKGVCLCGGKGTRLGLSTRVINKHMLPVYDRPMVYYPLATLREAGITEVAVIVSNHTGDQIIKLLRDGQELGLKLTYYFQNKDDGGIADALSLAKDFAGDSNICVILGDNCTDANLSSDVQAFREGAQIFLKEVENPREFGCPRFEQDKIVEIIEKPEVPPSKFAITGVYFYDPRVFDYIQKLQPSSRGQLEVSDLNQKYLDIDELKYSHLAGFWSDAGTPDSLVKVNQYWYWKNK